MKITENRLEKQIQFIVEIDKLKTVARRTLLITDPSRYENSAEHSWHIAVAALILSEYAEKDDIDILCVLKMLLIHDLVEIDAGDTYCHDEEGNRNKAEREKSAADRIFSLLPPDQSEEFRELWNEFEARETPESRFCAVVDRLQPLLHAYHTHGRVWKERGISAEQEVIRNRPIENGSPILWEYVLKLIDEAVERGILGK